MSPAQWPNLVFTEGGVDQLAKVAAFLNELDASENPKAGEIRDEFMNRMDYLNGYGGPVSDADPTRRYKVRLSGDWAPLSFGLTWQTWSPSRKEYSYGFNGGLIWHGGSNDPLTITLVPQWWGIHT